MLILNLDLADLRLYLIKRQLRHLVELFEKLGCYGFFLKLDENFELIFLSKVSHINLAILDWEFALPFDCLEYKRFR